MTTTRYSLRALSIRPLREFLTLGGVAVGVAVLVAAWSAVDAVRSAYRDWFASMSGKESLEIVAPAHAGFNSLDTVHLSRIPGVRSLTPRIVATAAFAEGSNGAPVVIYGQRDAPADFELCSGQPFGRGEGAWLDERTAAARRWAIGSAIRLWTPNGEASFPVLGIMKPFGSMGRSGTPIVCLPLAAAQRCFGFAGQVTCVEVGVTDGADTEVVKNWLARELPAGLIVSSSHQRGGSLRPMMAAVEHGLSALGLIALVTAGFVVVNTFTMNLSERRSQIAVLQALGATRSQLLRILLQESALLGTVGSILGTLVGLALAPAMTGVFSQFLGLPLSCSSPSPALLAAAILLGPCLSLTVTYVLAHEAAGRPPLRELLRPRGSVDPADRRTVPWRSVTLFGAALVLNFALIRNDLPTTWQTPLLAPALALLQAAAVPLLPSVVRPMLRIAGHCLQCWFPVEGRLAQCQLLRRMMRTSLTVGILFIASATAVGFGHWLLNSMNDIRRWYSRSIVADYLVRGCMTDANFLLSAPLPDSVGEELERLPGIDRIDRIAFVSSQVNGRPALVLARTIAADRPAAVDLRQGDPPTVLRKLLAGEAVLGTALANRLNVGVGDTIVLESVTGLVELRVAGTVTEYASGGEVLYLEWSKAKALLHIAGAHVFLVSARKGENSLSPAAIQTFCDEHHLLLQSNNDLRDLIDKMPERLEATLWVLIALTFVLASLGVTNTLTMNILEQAPELGTLQAIGMTGRQARRVILGQAFLLAVTGLFLGCLAGIGLAWLLNGTTNAVFGRQVAFTLHVPMILGCFVIGVLITMLAALIPARRSRLTLRSRAT